MCDKSGKQLCLDSTSCLTHHNQVTSENSSNIVGENNIVLNKSIENSKDLESLVYHVENQHVKSNTSFLHAVINMIGMLIGQLFLHAVINIPLVR